VGVLTASKRDYEEHYAPLGILNSYNNDEELLLADDFDTIRFDTLGFAVESGVYTVVTSSSPEAYANAVKQYPKAHVRKFTL
jgi:hypothetical protein